MRILEGSSGGGSHQALRPTALAAHSGVPATPSLSAKKFLSAISRPSKLFGNYRECSMPQACLLNLIFDCRASTVRVRAEEFILDVI